MIKGKTTHAPQPRGPQPIVNANPVNEFMKVKYMGIHPHLKRAYHVFEIGATGRTIWYDCDAFRGILIRHGHTYTVQTHKTNSMYVNRDHIRAAIIKDSLNPN